MALVLSMILAGISIGLLIIYGADVAAAQGGDAGFLPFDHKARGLGLGIPSIILPIAAFFISRREPSKTLGALIIVAGVLIIIGGIAVLAISEPADAMAAGVQDEGKERQPIAEAVPLLAVGVFIVALGAIKLIRS